MHPRRPDILPQLTSVRAKKDLQQQVKEHSKDGGIFFLLHGCARRASYRRWERQHHAEIERRLPAYSQLSRLADRAVGSFGRVLVAVAGGDTITRRLTLVPFQRSAELKTWLRQHAPSAAAINGIFYRVSGPNFTSDKDLVSGAGARTRAGGGRWNPPGLFSALYVSDEAETALAESLAHSRRNGIPDYSTLPKVIVGVEVRCTAVVDLTDPALASTLPIELPSMIGERWWSMNDAGREAGTQALGRLAEEEGLHGLLAPSMARPGHKNLLVFVDRLPRRSCHVKIVHGSKLKDLGR